MKSVASAFYTYLLTEKRVSPNTFDAYRRDLEQFIAFLQKQNLDLKTVSLKELKAFLHYLKNAGLLARSMSRKISTLKLFFSYLHQKHGLRNYAEELTFPRLEKKLPHYLSEKSIEQLLHVSGQDQSPVGIRNKVMLYLLYTSGMRISELTHMKCSSIHFDTGFLAIQGKGGKERMIPLPQLILELLRNYMRTVHRSFVREKEHVGKTDYLFPIYYAKKIKPISRQAFWIILKNLCIKANVSSVSPHTLRHSLATHMLKKGVDLRSLQLLLGHENLSTIHVYTHVETSHVRKIYNKKHPRS